MLSGKPWTLPSQTRSNCSVQPGQHADDCSSSMAKSAACPMKCVPCLLDGNYCNTICVFEGDYYASGVRFKGRTYSRPLPMTVFGVCRRYSSGRRRPRLRRCSCMHGLLPGHSPRRPSTWPHTPHSRWASNHSPGHGCCRQRPPAPR